MYWELIRIENLVLFKLLKLLLYCKCLMGKKRHLFRQYPSVHTCTRPTSVETGFIDAVKWSQHWKEGRGEGWKMRSVVSTDNYTWNEKYTRIGLAPATSTSPAVYRLKWLVPPNYSKHNFLFQSSTDSQRMNKNKVLGSSKFPNFSTHAASLSSHWKFGR